MGVLAAGAIGPNEITVFLLSVGVLLGLAKLLGEVARRFGQPSVLGEILAGVLLGPTLLGAVAPTAYGWLFPEHAAGGDPAHPQMHVVYVGLSMLVTLSVVLLLLVAGLEVDLSSVARQGRATLLVSLMGIVIPFATGFALGWFLPEFLGHHDEKTHLPFALFMGIALSISALPVIAKILMDLNIAKSDTGAMILSAAMINDFLGWIGFALVLAMMQVAPGGPGGGGETGAEQIVENVAEPIAATVSASGEEAEAIRHVSEAPAANVGMTVLLVLAFAAVMMTAGRWAAHRVLPWVQAHLSWPGGVLVFIVTAALLCAAFTEWIGIHAIFGAFILGVVMGDSSHLTGRTREMIHQFVTNIFAPIFFATIGLRLSLLESFRLDLVVVLLVVAVIGKLGGSYLGGWLAGLRHRESLAVGSGLVARGAMEIILGQLAYSYGLIGEELLVAIVVMALATSMMAGPSMQWLLQRKTAPKLANLVDGQGFIPELRATTRQQVIAELAEVGAKITGVEAREIYERAWRRERRYSTGLQHGIAVPHARLDGLPKRQVVVGVSKSGIDFDAMDGEPSQIICLLLTPEEDPNAQVELLDVVARTFSSQATRRATLEARSITQFKAGLAINDGGHGGGNDSPDVQPAELLGASSNEPGAATGATKPNTAGPKRPLPG